MPADPFLRQLMTLPTVLHARLSPDGRRVAFVWYRVHENMDVFVAPTDGSAPPIALTHTPEATWLVGWTGDLQAVIVQEDHDSDEHVTLFRVDLARPLAMQPLTEDRPPYFIRGGGLHPDGSTLFYGANYDFAAGQVIEPTWIYRHDLNSGERTPIACPKKPAFTEVSLNPQGTHVLYARKDRHPSGRQFHLVDAEGGEDREILNFGDQVKVFARWFPDGENILVISESTGGQPQEHISLGIYHWPTRRLRWLLDDPQRMIEGAWVSPDGMVVVDEIRHAVHRPSYLDPQTGLETPFPVLPGNLMPLGRAPDGAWLALYYSAVTPPDLVRLAPDAAAPGDLVSLTRLWEHTALRPEQLTPAESIRLVIAGWGLRPGLAVPRPP